MWIVKFIYYALDIFFNYPTEDYKAILCSNKNTIILLYYYI